MERTRTVGRFALLLLPIALGQPISGDEPDIVQVEGQPLAANVLRVLQSLQYLGTPLSEPITTSLTAAARAQNATKLQQLLDPHVLCVVSINPESRVKVSRGAARAELQQAGYTPALVKVVNLSTVTKSLNIHSPQAGPVYAGVAELSMKRQGQEYLRQNENVTGERGRFLAVEMFDKPPMTPNLSGLEVEYAIALLFSAESGKREATLGFDVGQGSQDIGFRGEVPILFDIRPAIPVRLSIRDHDGTPSAARLRFRDRFGHVVPPQAKRLAPDLFFQQQIYRGDGDIVLLPPGELSMQFSRGPEYRLLDKTVLVPEFKLRPPSNGAKEDAAKPAPAMIDVQLERWIDPARYGFYSGDHHIHGAGCAHYTSPTEGVTPKDMFLQVKGEGLNVGCVLTWGPCFDFQRQYFRPHVDEISEPLTLVKYDLEISGFGSQALGHVCLLNLEDQVYPGSDGTKTKGWPTWTTPVMRWAKEQGGVTGYAHSASGLEINSNSSSKRIVAQLDQNQDGWISREEATGGLLPEEFAAVDLDGDRRVSEAELIESAERVADQLPNLAIPEMNGVGAMEICVTTALGVCDFISAMDTPRIQEWNMWYHILNCGFPLKVSGETDFPCMSSTRVGQGRVYVQLGQVDRVHFTAWCDALRRGRSYVSDGYAHSLEFTVAGQSPGFEDVHLERPGEVEVRGKVAFAHETPVSVAHGPIGQPVPKRSIGDTVLLRGSKPDVMAPSGTRLVELVVNGVPVASKQVVADGKEYDVAFTVAVDRSSWVALRHFPQLHTNPVNVLVGNRPIRASRTSALWCIETIKQLWRARAQAIAPDERSDAEKAFQEAIRRFEQIATEGDLGAVAARP